MGILSAFASGVGAGMSDVATQNMQQQNQMQLQQQQQTNQLQLIQANSEAETTRAQALLDMQMASKNKDQENTADDINDAKTSIVNAAMAKQFPGYDPDNLTQEQKAFQIQKQNDAGVTAQAAMQSGHYDEASQAAQVGMLQAQATSANIHALSPGQSLIAPDGSKIADNNSTGAATLMTANTNLTNAQAAALGTKATPQKNLQPVFDKVNSDLNAVASKSVGPNPIQADPTNPSAPDNAMIKLVQNVAASSAFPKAVANQPYSPDAEVENAKSAVAPFADQVTKMANANASALFAMPADKRAQAAESAGVPKAALSSPAAVADFLRQRAMTVGNFQQFQKSQGAQRQPASNAIIPRVQSQNTPPAAQPNNDLQERINDASAYLAG